MILERRTFLGSLPGILALFGWHKDAKGKTAIQPVEKALDRIPDLQMVTHNSSTTWGPTYQSLESLTPPMDMEDLFNLRQPWRVDHRGVPICPYTVSPDAEYRQQLIAVINP